MTIKEYLGEIEKTKPSPGNPDGLSFMEAMQETTEIWSADACKGYFIRAAQTAGLEKDIIREVLREYRDAFEDLSVDMAAELYSKYLK